MTVLVAIKKLPDNGNLKKEGLLGLWKAPHGGQGTPTILFAPEL